MGNIIGITADTGRSEEPPHRKHEYYWVKTDLPSAVIAAGGNPFIIPVCETLKQARQVVKYIDGLIISGGNFDIDPAMYGQPPAGTRETKSDRSNSEIYLLKAAISRKIPVLGICGGEQLINVFFGGTLHQDILAGIEGSFDHEQRTHYSKPAHDVKTVKGTILSKIVKAGSIGVNSTHHQAVDRLGKGLVASAYSDDSVIEAVEKPGEPFILGVQWHPEFLMNDKANESIFKTFVACAKRGKR